MVRLNLGRQSMKKYRRGIQKELSAIFDGVWIPQKARSQRPCDVDITEQQQKKQTETQAEAQTEMQAQTEMRAEAQTAIEAETQTEIEEIIRRMKCSKDFECYRSGFEKLGKVRTTANTKLIQCLAENQRSCEFRFSFAGRSFCKCQLRHYIAKNLRK